MHERCADVARKSVGEAALPLGGRWPRISFGRLCRSSSRSASRSTRAARARRPRAVDALVLGRPDLSVAARPDAASGAFSKPQARRTRHPDLAPLGVALALGLTRWRGRGAGSARFVTLFPLVDARDRDGRRALPRFQPPCSRRAASARPRRLLGHVTFSISFVVVIVRGRLLAIGKRLRGGGAWTSAPHPLQALRTGAAAAARARHLRQRDRRLRDLDRRLRDQRVPLVECRHRDGAGEDLLQRPRHADACAQRARERDAVRDHPRRVALFARAGRCSAAARAIAVRRGRARPARRVRRGRERVRGVGSSLTPSADDGRATSG